MESIEQKMEARRGELAGKVEKMREIYRAYQEGPRRVKEIEEELQAAAIELGFEDTPEGDEKFMRFLGISKEEQGRWEAMIKD